MNPFLMRKGTHAYEPIPHKVFDSLQIQAFGCVFLFSHFSIPVYAQLTEKNAYSPGKSSSNNKTLSNGSQLQVAILLCTHQGGFWPIKLSHLKKRI